MATPRRVGAWRLPPPAPRPTADHVWRHEQVIEHLMTDHAVLPARFGTTFGDDGKLAAQAAKLGKPMAEVAGGKVASPFTALSNMVLSHASEEGVVGDAKPGARSLVENLKSMLAKPKDKAA